MSLSPTLPAATPAPTAAAAPIPAAETAKRAAIAQTAKSFEASFLSIMMQSMFSGEQAGAFGGGKGEDAFKSFMADAFAKQTEKAGGLGLSKAVEHEMLKLQGLS